MEYKEYEPVLKRKAFYYSKTYGFDYNDLFSETQEIFCIACNKYQKKEGGSFKSWLNFMLKTRLNAYIKKRCNNEITNVCLPKKSYYDDTVELIWLNDCVKQMDWKTKKIIQLILYPTKKQIRQLPLKLTKHSLKLYLQVQEGWKAKIVNTCFNEIKQGLGI